MQGCCADATIRKAHIQQAAANAQNQRSMPGDESFQGQLIAVGQKPLQGLAVGQPRDRPRYGQPCC